MNLELTAKLLNLNPVQTGEGKNGQWTKQEFIVETVGDQYPKKVCVQAWGDLAKTIQAIKPESMIKIFFNIESNEFNGKWYTNAKAWRIDVAGAVSDNSQQAKAPAHQAESVADPMSAEAGAGDDLPF